MKTINKKFILIIYLILLTAWCVIAVSMFMKYLGIRAFNRGEYKKARDHFSSVLLKDRKLIGITYYKENLFEEAFDYYEKAGDPQGMGLAYLGLSNYEKAIEYFEEAGDHRGKGLALMGQKKYEEALELFKEANDPSGLGLAYLSMGDLDKAEGAFRKNDDYFGLGVVLFSKGERFAAIEAFQESSNDTARGISYLLKGNLNKAKKYFRKKSDPTIDGFFNNIIGHYDRASEIYIFSKDEQRQGKLLMKLGQYGYAYEKLSGISDYENLGELLYQVKDYERAFEYFKKADKNKRAFDCLMARQDIDRAVEFATEILHKEINNPQLRLSIAEIYRAERKFDFALQQLEKIGKSKAYRDLSSLYKARTYYSSKDYEKASEELQRLEDRYEDRSWQRTIAQSADNLNILSGKILMEVKGKVISEPVTAKEEEPFDDDEEFEEESKAGWIGWILLLLIVGAGAGSAFWFFHLRDTSPAVERESLIKTKKKKGRKNKQAEEELINVPQILGIEESPFDGISVLLNIVKKQGVKTDRADIIELSGEGEDKLSVYGIYLASRAKGLAVKGIKIDWDYLMEVKTPVIVFFKDETFGHLMNISEENIALDMGIEKLVRINQKDFMHIWNEYVMIFGVS